MDKTQKQHQTSIDKLQQQINQAQEKLQAQLQQHHQTELQLQQFQFNEQALQKQVIIHLVYYYINFLL